MRTINDWSEIPVIIDPPLCTQFFENKSIRQQPRRPSIAKRSALDDTYTREHNQDLQRNTKSQYEGLYTTYREAEILPKLEPVSPAVERNMHVVQKQLDNCKQLNEQLAVSSAQDRDWLTERMEEEHVALETSVNTMNQTMERLTMDRQQEKAHYEKQLQVTRNAQTVAEAELDQCREQMDQLQEKHRMEMKKLTEQLQNTSSRKVESDEAYQSLQQKQHQIEAEKNEKIRELEDDIKVAKLEIIVLRDQLEIASNEISQCNNMRRQCASLKKEAHLETTRKLPKPKAQRRLKKDPNESVAKRVNFESDDSEDEEEDMSHLNASTYMTPSSGATVAQMGDSGQNGKDNDGPGKTFIATPAKFGLPIWSDLECSFLEHLMQCERGLEHAVHKKVSLEEQQNLLLLTLPRDYQYVVSYLETADKSTMAKFKAKLIELIMGTNYDQSSLVINAHRKPDERILSYLLRIVSTYKYCTNKTAGDLESDTWFTMMMYNKMLETLPLAAKAEFQRECEASMTNGAIAFSKLKAKVITVARKVPSLESVASRLAGLRGLGERNPPPGDAPGPAGVVSSVGQQKTPWRNNKSFARNNDRRKDDRACFYCKKKGHLKANCYKLNRDLNNPQPRSNMARKTLFRSTTKSNFRPKWAPKQEGRRTQDTH